MSSHDAMRDLRTVAKRFARAQQIGHAKALDHVAREIGHPHWNALRAASKKGWLPSQDDLDRAAALLESTAPGDETEGVIDGHAYRIDVGLDDVHMTGRGWHIHVPEAPMTPPTIEVTDRRDEANPIYDPAFVEKALAIANAKAQGVRSLIASDWLRRSTKPDARGRATHPLGGGTGDEWHCLHCDAARPARDLAANLWHCPACGATPIDVFRTPWWREEWPPAEAAQQ